MKKLDGIKFRRQHPINRYILDFYCHITKLSIEVDGQYHMTKSQKTYDEDRAKNLKAPGITEIRFTNEEITSNLSKVIDTIRANLTPQT